ncbi:hypothetical protein ES703_125140 [subsurface metagenome]
MFYPDVIVFNVLRINFFHHKCGVRINCNHLLHAMALEQFIDLIYVGRNILFKTQVIKEDTAIGFGLIEVCGMLFNPVQCSYYPLQYPGSPGLYLFCTYCL